MHRKLANSEARIEVIVQVGMEAYKLSKDCKDQKIAFSIMAYNEGKDEVQRKWLAHFSDLFFLDEDLKAKEELGTGFEGAANPFELTV